MVWRITVGFEYSAKQIDKETYEGNLYLIDKEERIHQILEFDDENEKYVMNDLKWFSEYFMNHLGIISVGQRIVFVNSLLLPYLF